MITSKSPDSCTADKSSPKKLHQEDVAGEVSEAAGSSSQVTGEKEQIGFDKVRLSILFGHLPEFLKSFFGIRVTSRALIFYFQ